jgi:hypothetical protein
MYGRGIAARSGRIDSEYLSEPRIFGLGLFQDRDAGVGVFPKREVIDDCSPGGRSFSSPIHERGQLLQIPTVMLQIVTQ